MKSYHSYCMFSSTAAPLLFCSFCILLSLPNQHKNLFAYLHILLQKMENFIRNNQFEQLVYLLLYDEESVYIDCFINKTNEGAFIGIVLKLGYILK